METTVGEIKPCSSSFEWKIKNFSSLSAQPGECYESPPFDFYNATWCLVVYPNGNTNSSSSYTSVFLKKLNYHEINHTVFQKISIKKSDGTDYICRECKSEHRKSKVTWGHREFLERSKVLEAIDSEGDLRISCTVNWDCYDVTPVSERVATKNEAKPPHPKILWKSLVRHLKDSFMKKKNCDMVIRVKEHDFPVHRMILVSRSPVFETMFEKDMLENRNVVLEISDTEPNVFQDFLVYLYCGDVDEMSTDNVYGLYALAEKYSMEDLKRECVKFMECNLCVEAVCDVLLLAEKYGEKQLNELAKSFVLKNANAVLSSAQWKRLEIQNHVLSNQILKSILLDKASKLN